MRLNLFEKGRYRMISLLLPWLRLLGPEWGKRIIKTQYGFRFTADLADWLGQYVYLTGAYEPPTSDIFFKIIKPGDTVIDIGANVGYFSLLSAKLTGEKGKVYALEPILSVRENLISNILLNDYNNIRVIPKAASATAARLTIYEGPEGHKGVSSLRPLSTASRELTIEAIALDDLIEEMGTVNFIKIDVEGAEMRALLGMKKIINKDHPSFIIEFTDSYLKSFGDSASQMAEWLNTHGYQLYRIEEEGLLQLDFSDPTLPGQYNVLATQVSPFALFNRNNKPSYQA